ncbi:mRNA export factor [Pancytospora philotis]|nr:mRNA export factor [Pancytospora philotis]
MFTNKSFLTRKADATVTEIPDCPADTVSDIAFSMDGAAVTVGSWDGTVSAYSMAPVYGPAGPSFQTQQPPKRELCHSLGKPVLSVAFWGAAIVAGLADGSLCLIDQSGQTNSIQAHSAAVKSIKNYNNQYVITGSFDGTIKFWDLKSSQPLHTVTLPGKVYAMALTSSMLSAALSNHTIYILDMNNIHAPATFTSRLAYPLRSISCASDLDTFAVGGVEAKIEVSSRAFEHKRFVIRSHRDGSKLYAVNVVRFHGRNENFIVTGGADGNLIWFDRVNRNKLATMTYNAPITAAEFSPDSRYFVFASGDDWSKGYTGAYIKPALRIVDVRTIQGLDK